MDSVKKTGVFCISLDFELHWGVCASHSLASYRANLDGTRAAIKGMLALFEQKRIHATWATVGFLFCKTKEEIQEMAPQPLPIFHFPSYSSYSYMDTVGGNEADDPYHFAAEVIEQIRQTPFQEIGTHTFSHFFCLEKGPALSDVEADLSAAIRIANRYQLPVKSIVFPRNQYNQEHLKICAALGIETYRGNPEAYLYLPRNRGGETLMIRALRFLDSYFNIGGHNVHVLPDASNCVPVNIPASRFLRPYHQRLKLLGSLQLRRIKQEMTLAAQTGRLYHLWWHPHNFGVNTQENLNHLSALLDHFDVLSAQYGMKSLNMQEVANV